MKLFLFFLQVVEVDLVRRILLQYFPHPVSINQREDVLNGDLFEFF